MDLRSRFRTVVAMWVVVGLLGGPFFLGMAVMLLTAVGPFEPRGTVRASEPFAPEEPVKVSGSDSLDVGPGEVLVLARPAGVDPDTVTCEWRTRVFTTGEHRSGVLEPVPVEGYRPVVRDTVTDLEYRPVRTTSRGTGWMEVDHLRCTGEGVEAFALADDDGLTQTFRLGAGAAAAFFGVLVTVLGFVALSVTRRWNRQDARHPGAPPTSPPPAPGTLPG